MNNMQNSIGILSKILIEGALTVLDLTFKMKCNWFKNYKTYFYKSPELLLNKYLKCFKNAQYFVHHDS